MVTIIKRCIECHKGIEINVTNKEYRMLIERNENKSIFIQDILPNKTAEQREIFISGLCTSCYDAIMVMFKE